MYWEDITSTDFFGFLRCLGIKAPNNKYYTAQDIAALRRSWVESGILQNAGANRGASFQIAGAELKEFFMREARLEFWFDDIIEIIQTNHKLSDLSHFYSDAGRYKERLLRDFRLAIYQKDVEKVKQLNRKIYEKQLNNIINIKNS